MEDFQYHAFLSCSLRNEDLPFVNLVESILKYHYVLPFGTVGRYDASPENPVALMKRNIEASDFIAVAATKRYITEDAHFGNKSNSISELLHTEAGMAFAHSKPVLVFVQEGTNVGNFLPSVTQYIILDGTQENLNLKMPLITQLINNTLDIVDGNRKKKRNDNFKQLATGALAMWGFLKILDDNLSGDDFDDE